jgi:hypothetical protein
VAGHHSLLALKWAEKAFMKGAIHIVLQFKHKAFE